MNTDIDADLLARAKCFDLQALAEIYDLLSPKLYSYAARLLGSQEEAEECVSETFARFLGALKNGRGPDSPDYLLAYLYRVAHNWITDQFRRKVLPADPLDDELAGEDTDTPDNQAQRILWVEQVRRSLLRLTPEQRQVIVLKYIEGWDNQEISLAMGKPVGSIKSLHHRGLASLRRILQVDVEDESES